MIDPMFFSFLLSNPMLMNLVLQGAIPFQALQEAFQQVRAQMPPPAPTVTPPGAPPATAPTTGTIQPSPALPGAFTTLPQNQATPGLTSFTAAVPPLAPPPMLPPMSPFDREGREPGAQR